MITPQHRHEIDEFMEQMIDDQVSEQPRDRTEPSEKLELNELRQLPWYLKPEGQSNVHPTHKDIDGGPLIV